MEDKSNQTINTYRENFHKYSERTASEVSGEFKEWEDAFCEKLPQGGLIFEIGSATGRDARYFKSKGFNILCTDVIPEALDNLAKEGFETSEFDFRNQPKDEWLNKFDGFFANAVLLHATKEVFEQALNNISKILKKDGVIAFSLKTGEGEEISTEKMDSPRYFKYYSEEEIRNILKNYPFEIISLSKADNDKWLHVILKNK